MTTLVLGAGVSGIAAARLARSLGHDIMFYDERLDASVPSELQPVSVACGRWSDDLLEGVDLVITSPGFPPRSRPLRDAQVAHIAITTEVGFALDQITSPYIAITGTNGKSTVTEAASRMLIESGIDAVAAGNIGVPVADLVSVNHEVLVVELSSFQLHWWRPRANAAALVNIAPDHLDWHGSFDAYVQAKAEVFRDLEPTGILAYDIDDAVVHELVSNGSVPSIPCARDRVPFGGNGVEGDTLVVGENRFRCDLQDASYRLDLVIAATVALAMGATGEGVGRVIAAFEPGENRRRVVGVIDGVTWINDSKATNPHAAVAATSSYSAVRLLAGGRNKALDLSAIGQVPTIKHVYAFGEAGPDIVAVATRPSSLFATMAEAMEAAHSEAEFGDTVLLSPGCTSFDEFSSYAERGRVFEDAVRAMNGGDVR